MRNIKAISAVTATLLIIVIIYWQRGEYHSNSTTPQSKWPPPNHQVQMRNPTATDHSEWALRLKSRDSANDLESITTTFKEAKECLLYHTALNEIISDLNDNRLDDLSNETLESLKHIDATSEKYLLLFRRTQSLCADSDQKTVATVYTNSVIKAALMGSKDAETCFVISNPNPTRNNISAKEEEILNERYLRYAPTFARNALERGDPYVAVKSLYQYIASPSTHHSGMDTLPLADPYLTWRAARLASFRVTPEQRTRIEGDLTTFEKKHLLQQSDIKQADEWAKNTFYRYFSKTPPIDIDSHAPCYTSPDLAP